MTKPTQEKSPRPTLLSHSSDSNLPPPTCHFLPHIFSYFCHTFKTFMILFGSGILQGALCSANFLKQKLWSNPGVTFPPLFMECCRPFHGFAPLLGIHHFRRGVIAMEIGATFPACPGVEVDFLPRIPRRPRQRQPFKVTSASPFSQWLPKMGRSAKGNRMNQTFDNFGSK